MRCVKYKTMNIEYINQFLLHLDQWRHNRPQKFISKGRFEFLKKVPALNEVTF